MSDDLQRAFARDDARAQRRFVVLSVLSALAGLGRSGVVVVPVCDTPFGTDPAWRGDDGKTVVHHVKGSSEAMVSGDQVRNYAFDNGVLVLSAEMAGIGAVLRWVR